MGSKGDRRWKLYFVIGEESGDALGDDLIAGLQEIGLSVEFQGLAGRRMQARGLKSLFDISDISVMGAAAVVARLPAIVKRIRQTADDIASKRPDMIVLIDSPEFTHRVARRVRRTNPEIPIVKYICPSVWAWRPGRARKMNAFVDHVLTILPFEPDVLRELGGPKATYVGHPLSARLARNPPKRKLKARKVPLLLLLPGSRRSEVKLLLPDIRQTLDILHERGNRFKPVMPVVPHLADEIATEVSTWKIRPDIVIDDEEKQAAFQIADAALAASGTVLLELALYRVPTISIYRLDWLMHQFRHLIFGWSAALPNLILDEALVPERVGDMVRPGWLARAIEALLQDGPFRKAQLDGFDRLTSIMSQDFTPGIMAARKISELLSTGDGRPD